MSRTIEKTQFMLEKGRGRGESVVPDPRAACHVRGQYSGLVSASGIRPRDGCHGAQRQGDV